MVVGNVGKFAIHLIVRFNCILYILIITGICNASILLVHTVRESKTCWDYISKTITDLKNETSGVYRSHWRSALHKNHNHPLPYFRVIALCYFFILKFCVEHISVTTKDISMKLYRKIDLNEKKSTAQET